MRNPSASATVVHNCLLEAVVNWTAKSPISPRTVLFLLLVLLWVPGAFARKHPVDIPKGADCASCHNSDDNREFGGQGPNGPHGSKWTHILERRYEFSQTATPGSTITNLFPNPDLSVVGPYAMCGKCHSLTNIVSNAGWSEHARHINDGFSCSVCHTAHGMGAQNGNISGERLVDFDVNVVAANGATPISYNRTTNSCALVCHNQAHTLTNGPSKLFSTPKIRPR